jgi:uncharacterized membrane protein
MLQDVRQAGVTHCWRYIIFGVLTLAPLWVTWLVFEFVLGLLYRFGLPWVSALARGVRPISGALSDLLLHPASRFALAVVITLTLLYLVGLAATRVVGKRLIERLEALLARLPLVHAIYGATKRFISAVREQPPGLQRVVLINFPSSQMKAVGFVTRVLTDQTTGREIAAVYVPTSPNPTSGYIEIVPVEDVVSTDWTVEEAMRFVMTGGTNAPAQVRFTAPPAAAGATAPAQGDARNRRETGPATGDAHLGS